MNSNDQPPAPDPNQNPYSPTDHGQLGNPESDSNLAFQVARREFGMVDLIVTSVRIFQTHFAQLGGIALVYLAVGLASNEIMRLSGMMAPLISLMQSGGEPAATADPALFQFLATYLPLMLLLYMVFSGYVIQRTHSCLNVEQPRPTAVADLLTVLKLTPIHLLVIICLSVLIILAVIPIALVGGIAGVLIQGVTQQEVAAQTLSTLIVLGGLLFIVGMLILCSPSVILGRKGIRAIPDSWNLQSTRVVKSMAALILIWLTFFSIQMIYNLIVYSGFPDPTRALAGFSDPGFMLMSLPAQIMGSVLPVLVGVMLTVMYLNYSREQQ